MSSLSAEQQAAVMAEDSSLVVSAAAGSGKTRVLVERYLKHVTEDGFRPDEILTITFTRKAASEMKNRIVKRLNEEGRADDAQVAETGPIQTIHGFCERMLRENSIDAGLDPEFSILSEAQAARIRESALRQVLSGTEGDEEVGELIRLLAGRRLFTDPGSPHARLESAVRQVVSALRGTGRSPEQLLERHRNPEALLQLWRSELLRNEIPEDIRAEIGEEPLDGGFAERLIAAYKAHRKARPRYLRPTTDEDLEAARHTCGLVRIAAMVWLRTEREMMRRQELDFTLLEAQAVELVKTSESACARLRRQYKVALIDEAQDLNPVQYELLQHLGLDVEMLVGDPQQSIYGFRQADVRLFNARRAEGSSLPLTVNRRSQKGILEFVDALFGALWGDEYVPMQPRERHGSLEVVERATYSGVEVWPQRQRDTHATALLIKEFVDEYREAGGLPCEVAVLVRKARFAMDLLRRLESAGVKARVSGGTEQFYARLEVRDLANALQALTDPFDDFSLLALLRSPFVGVSLDALILLREDASQPVVEKLPDFSSPVEGDNERIAGFLRWFNPLKSYADRLSAWEVISELFARTEYLEAIAKRRNGKQLLANVRKLLTLAAEEEGLGPHDFAERVREIQRIRHKEGDAPADDDDKDAITIMTVHKSKGLEFAAVIVPEMHWSPGRSTADVEVDPALSLVTTKFGKGCSMFHEWLATRRRERELQEEWRVMYVALTRAKSRLCLCLNPGSHGERFSEKIPKLLNYKDVPPGEIRVRQLLRVGSADDPPN
jgi:ATP-dependent helicase/nuclease subunit A